MWFAKNEIKKERNRKECPDHLLEFNLGKNV